MVTHWLLRQRAKSSFQSGRQANQKTLTSESQTLNLNKSKAKDASRSKTSADSAARKDDRASDSLSVKYRVRWLNGIIGTNPSIEALKSQLASNSSTRSFMFIGPLGSGKTTMQRIIAQSLSCLNPGEDGRPCNECGSCKFFKVTGPIGHPDVVEINCADHTGVDDMRNLRSTFNARPMIGRHRVVMLDEVQMLSKNAKELLLKPFEEPPPWLVIILSTMEPDAFSDTVGLALKSRATVVYPPRPGDNEIATRLITIAKREGHVLSKEMAGAIATKSDGIMRFALSALHTVISSGSSNVSDIEQVELITSRVVGKSPYELAKLALNGLYNQDVPAAIMAIAQSENAKFMLKLLIESNSNVIKARIDPKLIEHNGARWTASDLARTKLSTNGIARIGEKLQDVLKMTHDYSVDTGQALIHFAAALWPDKK
jgi:DNA polymerase III subunit gamma/tau